MDQIFWPYILCSFRALEFPFLSTEVGFSPISKAWAKEVHAIVNETMLLKVLDETTDTFEKTGLEKLIETNKYTFSRH